MPKLACPCGYVHNLSPIPDHGWHTGRDTEWEEIIKLEYEALFKSSENGAMHMLGSLYESPKCGRVMWEKPGEKVFKIYKLEQ